MNYEKHIISKAKKLGVIRPRDVNAPRTVLLELVGKGMLERTGWGLYQLPSLTLSCLCSQHFSFTGLEPRVHIKYGLPST
jgi:hypothetical protein